MKRSVWYLAHPLKPDEQYTVEQNMAHVVHMTRLFFEEGVYVCTPYHTCMLALDDTNLKHRAMGIEMDKAVLTKLNRIILVGHKVTVGMREELELIHSEGGAWENLTGLSDAKIHEYIETFRDNFI